MTPVRIFLTGSPFFSYIVLDIIGFHSLSSLIIMHLMGLFLVPLLYSFPHFSTLLPFLCWSLSFVISSSLDKESVGGAKRIIAGWRLFLPKGKKTSSSS